jgi:acetyl-CoA carboxylase biotin carboxylase subunit/propionyl-CoA carboxylase alpha chain
MERAIRNVLIANRGVPAVRIMHTCRDRKIRTTAVYSTPDRLAHHVHMADTAIHVGEAPPTESYLNIDRMIAAAVRSGADAIHAGWGFLAENAEFARRVADAGLLWIGPPPDVIARMGDKIEAKRLAVAARVPVIPGIEGVDSPEEIDRWMREGGIDFPIIIKAAAGGGGRGMVKVEEASGLAIAFNQARSEARKAFGNDAVFVEQYIEHGRHIEVQIVGDTHGNVVHLGERECTIQRRNQKIVEEAPSPSLDDDLRREICETAVRLMREIGYHSAGTVEFLLDTRTRHFYFLEVNTRLQVEHGITELITGLDIVGLMFDVALGRPLPFSQEEIGPNRWALEVRLNAEDPRSFNPSFGTVSRLQVPMGPNVRVASGVYEGVDVPPYYDSLLLLLITAGADRSDALRVMDRCLGRSLRVEGVKTLQPLLLSIIRHPAFIDGEFSTRFIEDHLPELVSKFADRNAEDDVLKIARYVAEASALGPRPWM